MGKLQARERCFEGVCDYLRVFVCPSLVFTGSRVKYGPGMFDQVLYGGCKLMRIGTGLSPDRGLQFLEMAAPLKVLEESSVFTTSCRLDSSANVISRH